MTSPPPTSGPEPGPPRYAPHPVSRGLALLLPLVVLFALAVPVGVAFGIRALRTASESPAPTRTVNPTTGPSADPDRGLPGVGDPYFPDYGSSGYDAEAYRIAVDVTPATATLRGITTITARATQRLDSFFVDLALPVQQVTVDDRPATFALQGFQDLQITPSRAVAAGARFRVTVTYAGRPGDLRRGQTTAFHATSDELMVAGEPESSAWWFPANDHPSDPALMDVSIRVPAGVEAISVGRLESRDIAQEADFDTWHWRAREPMATYLNVLAVGQYEIQTGTTGRRPYAYAVSERLPADQRTAAMAALRTSDAVVALLERHFGPYPFSDLGGIVPAHDLWFDGLETQTRPVYDARSITDPGFAAELIGHELAHMWFGDRVTVREWNDIFVNEAYAAYAQWILTEESGGPTAADRLERTYQRTADNADFWRVSMIDPGPERLFATVYARGPMTLQALRTVIGAEAFDSFTRAWAAEPGSRSLEQWMARAQAATPVDLDPFFRAWIFGTTVPERTTANGFR